MREQPQSVTLAFRDDALENAYQAQAAEKTRRAYRTLWIITTFTWSTTSLLDPYTAGPDNFRTVVTLRLALGTPLLVAVTLVGWASPPVFARLRQIGTFVGCAALMWVPPIMMLSVPDPVRLSEPSGPMSLAIAIISVFAWCGIVSTSLLLPVAAALVQLALIALCAGRVPPPESPSIAVWYLWSCILGIIIAFQIEQAKRREYLATRSLDAERARSESLLHNVLPAPIAERLKDKRDRLADHFEHSTVLFGDIVGFTPLSAELTPQELVATLDDIFSAFDDIADRHGLEKIKTIGDAYMVVGGVPTGRADHAEAVAAMALEMRDTLATKRFAGDRSLQMRIGIHSGPVVAGVIGKRKFIYDLWGDTVNTASRMESHGVEGEVQVTSTTADLLRERFELVRRGVVEVKGKGEMETWFLGRKKG